MDHKYLTTLMNRKFAEGDTDPIFRTVGFEPTLVRNLGFHNNTTKTGISVQGPLSLGGGGDLILQSAQGSSEMGDIVFSDSSGTEIHRLWSGTGTLNYRSTSSGTSYAMIHAGNLPTQATRWPTWSEVTSKPATFPPDSHTHAWSQVTGQPAQATRWPTWSEVTSKPSTFAPDSHTHSILDTNFGANLDSVTATGVYREETPSSGYSYTTTLNMNSSDGRQQLTISRDGGGMKFRGVNSGSGTTGWTSWKEVYHTGNMPTTATRWPTWSEVTGKPDYLARSRWGAAVPSPNAGDMYFT